LAFLEVYTKFKGDLSIRDQQGRSALIHAISNDHIHFVSNLCEYSKVFSDDRMNSSSLLELQDRHGNTPLFTAIRFDLPEVLQILISYKCNFFHQKRNGNTCLHDCAVYNAVDCLTMLASYCGRDLFQMFNKDGKRAIDVAIKLKNGQIMHAL
jgi:ankyrin repeat protein